MQHFPIINCHNAKEIARTVKNCWFTLDLRSVKQESASLRVSDVPSTTLHSVTPLTVANRTGGTEKRSRGARREGSSIPPLACDSRLTLASCLPPFADFKRKLYVHRSSGTTTRKKTFNFLYDGNPLCFPHCFRLSVVVTYTF